MMIDPLAYVNDRRNGLDREKANKNAGEVDKAKVRPASE